MAVMIGDPAVNRALFCMGVLPAFYEAESTKRREVFNALQTAFGDLNARFGVTVLGTLDDDRTVVGPSSGYPWTCYILAEVPNLDAVTLVCNIVRETELGGERLWKYIKIEARFGRELFYGRS